MIFDRMCKTISVHGDKEQNIACKRARIFDFSNDNTVLSETVISEEHLRKLNEGFILPFDTIVVEDKNEATIIRRDDDKVGFPAKYTFITYSNCSGGEFILTTVDLLVMQMLSTDTGMAEAKLFKIDTIMPVDGVAKKISIDDILAEDREPFAKQTMAAAIRSLYRVFSLYQEDKFILEASPRKNRKNKLRVVTSHDRPKYTILKPKEIREKTGMSTGLNGTGRTPHERRAHWRVLKHEKYKDNIGKIIKVKATWIGESEKVVGNKRYKVIL